MALKVEKKKKKLILGLKRLQVIYCLARNLLLLSGMKFRLLNITVSFPALETVFINPFPLLRNPYLFRPFIYDLSI